MILYHGDPEKFDLHIGQSFTADRDTARKYAGSTGMFMSIDLDIHAIEVEEVEGYDGNSKVALGDNSDDGSNADVITYTDKDQWGRSHKSWRLMSEAALLAVTVLDVKDNTNLEWDVDLDEDKEDEQDDNKYAKGRVPVKDKHNPAQSISVSKNKSDEVASKMASAMNAIASVKMQTPPHIETPVLRSPKAESEQRHSSPQPKADYPKANQRPWSNTDKVPIIANAASRLMSPSCSTDAMMGVSASGEVRKTKMNSPQSMPHCRKMRNPDMDMEDVDTGESDSMEMESPRNLTQTSKRKDYSLASPDSNQQAKRQEYSSVLQQNSNEIKRHEERHSAAMRESDPQAKPQITEAKGPDGRKYAVAGEVNADASPVPGNPKATEKKAEALYRSAMSDQKRSKEDNEVGRKALELGQQARQSKQMQSPDSQSNQPKMQSATTSPQSQSMSSPNNKEPVTMRNPAIALAGRAASAVASRVAGAVGGAASQYAGQSAAGSTSRWAATNVARGARSSARRYRSSAGRAEMTHRIQRSFDKLAATTERVDTSMGGFANRLKDYSAEISVAKAQNTVQQIQFDIQNARRLGPALSRFTKAEGNLSIARQASAAEFAEGFLPIKTAALNALATFTDLKTIVARFIGSIIGPNGYIATILTSIPGVKFSLDKIVGSVEWMQNQLAEWARRQKNGQLDDNIKAFFSMEVPQPMEKAQVAGPKFNLPMPAIQNLPFQPALGN